MKKYIPFSRSLVSFFFVLLFAGLSINPSFAAKSEKLENCERQLTRQQQEIFLIEQLNHLNFNRNAVERFILRHGKKPLSNHIINACTTRGKCTEKDLAEAARVAVMDVSRMTGQTKGYAVLIGAMIGSAALGSHLTDLLPDSAKFLSQLVGQLSTIGIFVLGAPIWEPISSGFRKWAFGFSNSNGDATQPNQDREDLEKLWQRTQSQYSHNAQMSRNVLNNFILTTHQNFRSAYQAMHETDQVAGREYAVDQIAEAAIRMRILFTDISPDDPHVARAVHATFARHAKDLYLRESVLARIFDLDPDAEKNELNLTYYIKLLETWLVL